MASLYNIVLMSIYIFGLRQLLGRTSPLVFLTRCVLAPIKGILRPYVFGCSFRVIHTGLVLLRAQSLIFDIYSVHGSGAPVFIGPGKAVTSAGCSNTSLAFVVVVWTRRRNVLE